MKLWCITHEAPNQKKKRELKEDLHGQVNLCACESQPVSDKKHVVLLIMKTGTIVISFSLASLSKYNSKSWSFPINFCLASKMIPVYIK